MRYSKQGLELTESFERLKLSAYKDNCKKQLRDSTHICTETCAGVWTIGFGHTGNVKCGQTVSAKDAEQILMYDISFAEKAVNKFVTVELTQGQFDALTDFVFNVGAENFRTSTLLLKLNNADYDDAKAELDKWVYDNHVRLEGLQKRRDAEQLRWDS